MKFQILAVFAVSTNLVNSQHIEDIRKKLYPHLDSTKMTSSIHGSYTAVDYSGWEVNPDAEEFSEAFKGYYTLERLLTKRSKESLDRISKKMHKDFISASDEWTRRRNEACDKEWRPNELGFSMMVLDYLYCMNLKTRQRIDSLAGIMSNSKLYLLIGIRDYKIGTEFSVYEHTCDFLSEGKNGYRIYQSREGIIINGHAGNTKLLFYQGVLHQIVVNLNACRCIEEVKGYLIDQFGEPAFKKFNAIEMVETYGWTGATVQLVLNRSFEDETVSFTLKKLF